MTTIDQTDTLPDYLLPADQVAERVDVDPARGLSSSQASTRLAEHGPNSIPTDPPPSYFQVLLTAGRDPMNLMLLAVTAASFAIGQTSTAILVGALVLLNVVMAANQEMKAKATVAALEDLQVPS